MAENDEQVPDFQRFYPLNDDGSCAVTDRDSIIDRYVAKELREEERDAFDVHTFHCKICFLELREREELAEVLAERMAQEQQRNVAAASVLLALIQHRYFRRAVFFAAPVILIVAIIFGVRSYQQAREEQRTLFAANSAESSVLEHLVDQYKRAAGIEVVSPRIGAAIQNEIVFEWQGGTGERLTITILNNREEEMQRFSTAENRLVFHEVKKTLAPGLYYWKLEDENDLIYVGKFYVGKPD